MGKVDVGKEKKKRMRAEESTCRGRKVRNGEGQKKVHVENKYYR